jgi:hypothetical protein
LNLGRSVLGTKLGIGNAKSRLEGFRTFHAWTAVAPSAPARADQDRERTLTAEAAWRLRGSMAIDRRRTSASYGDGSVVWASVAYNDE